MFCFQILLVLLLISIILIIKEPLLTSKDLLSPCTINKALKKSDINSMKVKKVTNWKTISNHIIPLDLHIPNNMKSIVSHVCTTHTLPPESGILYFNWVNQSVVPMINMCLGLLATSEWDKYHIVFVLDEQLSQMLIPRQKDNANIYLTEMTLCEFINTSLDVYKNRHTIITYTDEVHVDEYGFHTESFSSIAKYALTLVSGFKQMLFMDSETFPNVQNDYVKEWITKWCKSGKMFMLFNDFSTDTMMNSLYVRFKAGSGCLSCSQWSKMFGQSLRLGEKYNSNTVFKNEECKDKYFLIGTSTLENVINDQTYIDTYEQIGAIPIDIMWGQIETMQLEDCQNMSCTKVEKLINTIPPRTHLRDYLFQKTPENDWVFSKTYLDYLVKQEQEEVVENFEVVQENYPVLNSKVTGNGYKTQDISHENLKAYSKKGRTDTIPKVFYTY